MILGNKTLCFLFFSSEHSLEEVCSSEDISGCLLLFYSLFSSSAQLRQLRLANLLLKVKTFVHELAMKSD